MSLRSLLAWLGFSLLLGAWFVLSYYSLTLGMDWAAFLYPEDHFFENLGAASLFLASIVSLIVFWRAVRKGNGWIHPLRSALYLGMALIFFFAGGEEISWGQRLFNIPEPPALAAQSPQQDLSLHGLTPVKSNPLLHSETLFYDVLALLALGIPAALVISPTFHRAAEKNLPLPLLGTAPLFLLNQLMSGWARDSYKPWYRYQVIRFPQALQAIKEANFELLCLCLAIIAWIELTGRLRNRGFTSGTEPPAG